MSKVAVNELYTDRGGSSTTGKLALTRSYYVETDSADDGVYEILGFEGLPVLGEAHPSSADMQCVSVQPTPMADDQYHWIVKVTYEPFLNSSGTVTRVIKPWERDPVIRFGQIARQQIMEFCYQKEITTVAAFDVALTGDNRPARDVKVVNSSGMPFDPPATYDEYLMTIIISKNVTASSFDPIDIYKYQNTVNKTDITVAGITIPARRGYLGAYTADKNWYIESATSPMGTGYYALSYTITIDPDEWVRKIVDAGMWTRDDVSTGLYKYTSIKDDQNKRLLEPVLLNGAGQQLEVDDDPVYHFCHVLWEEEWSGLSLPASV